MYVLVGLLLTLTAIIELGTGIAHKRTSFFVWILFLTVMLAVRYGQGTDYYGYYLQYNGIDARASLFVNSLHHGELGWYMLLIIANRIGMSFEIFIMIISVIMMGSIGKVIEKYSPYKIWSLLILYPTYYLTYCFSAIRQGLVMSLFLGFGLDFLIEKKYTKYYVLSVLLILFHRSAFILLLLPCILHFRKYHIEKYCVFAVLFAVLFGCFGVLDKIASIIGIVNYVHVSIRVMAIILRTILFLVIFMMHRKNQKYRESNDYNSSNLEDILYFIYLIGYMIYLTLAFAGTLSQRLTMPLKAVEVLLLPLLLYNLVHRSGITATKMKYLKIGRLRILGVAMLVIFMLNVETVKNINSYIEQGNYYSWVTPLNYPYSTIFDKEYVRKYLFHFNNEVN